MDKTSKIFLIFIGTLAVFAVSKDLILSLLISFWLLFWLFYLPYQFFLFFSLFLLVYYLVLKNISFVIPAIMVVLGLILAVLPKIDSGQDPGRARTTVRMTIKGGSNKFLPSTKTMGFLLLLAFFLFALVFSYQEYQNQQISKVIKKEKPVEKVIIRLNK